MLLSGSLRLRPNLCLKIIPQSDLPFPSELVGPGQKPVTSSYICSVIALRVPLFPPRWSKDLWNGNHHLYIRQFEDSATSLRSLPTSGTSGMSYLGFLQSPDSISVDPYLSAAQCPFPRTVYISRPRFAASPEFPPLKTHVPNPMVRSKSCVFDSSFYPSPLQ